MFKTSLEEMVISSAYDAPKNDEQAEEYRNDYYNDLEDSVNDLLKGVCMMREKGMTISSALRFQNLVSNVLGVSEMFSMYIEKAEELEMRKEGFYDE